jgi:hypothetical protein
MLASVKLENNVRIVTALAQPGTAMPSAKTVKSTQHIIISAKSDASKQKPAVKYSGIEE